MFGEEYYWCYYVILAVLLTIILSYTSAKFNFLLKFTYLYSGYTLVSAIIVLAFWWRPRNRKNGYYAAKMLQWVHKLIPIEFKIEGGEMLTDPGAAVVVMNHQSSIDLMSMFEMWPLFSFAGPIGKRELLFIQPFGLACWMCATEFLNRRSKTSHQDINQMGARAKETGKKLFIYPEGTRNSAKGLTMLPFKKGAFHIAVDCKLPIQPIVLSEYDFLDVKKWIFNPGKVTIKVLPRIDTSGYTKDNLDDLVSHTRNLMIEELRNLAKPNKTD